MSNEINKFTFEYKGREFIRRTYFDTDHEPPWLDGDGRAIVSDHKKRDDKRPGERPLTGSRDHGEMRYFHWEQTTAKAKKEGWGLHPEDIKKLEAKLGRKLTHKMIVRAAVEREFVWINKWLNDEWCYVWVEVEDTVTKQSSNCGGFESTDEDGIHEYALNAAEELYDPPLLVEMMDRKLKEMADAEGA